ncbi:hypothetical protein KM043_013951 [Ampulex compressa]|nr:hypothetical protein KM043_013951 [Ampulex compressa]
MIAVDDSDEQEEVGARGTEEDDEEDEDEGEDNDDDDVKDEDEASSPRLEAAFIRIAGKHSSSMSGTEGIPFAGIGLYLAWVNGTDVGVGDIYRRTILNSAFED